MYILIFLFSQVNGKVKVLIGEGKAEDVKAGVEEDPEADVAISCPLCGAMFDMTTGECSRSFLCVLVVGSVLLLSLSLRTSLALCDDGASVVLAYPCFYPFVGFTRCFKL